MKRPKTNNDLAWITSSGEAISVNELGDQHLINCIALMRRSLAKQRLLTGKLNVKALVLHYLEDEAADRGLNLGYSNHSNH